MESGTRRILIVGGGTAGWLSPAYLAKALDLPENPALSITLLESPDIGIIGVVPPAQQKSFRSRESTHRRSILIAQEASNWLPRPDLDALNQAN